MEKQLFLLLLKSSFYEKNKLKVLKAFFSNKLGDLYETLKILHEEYNRDISLNELKIYHEITNPTLTRSVKEILEILFIELENTECPSEDILHDLLNSLWIQEQGRRIAEHAIDIMNGKTNDFSVILKALEDTDASRVSIEGLQPVTSDIDELLKEVELSGRYRFNLAQLQESVGGIGPGNFAIIFARPETGKTAFWVSLCTSPGGFCEQGAKTHVIINEEPAVRTQMRAISACCGKTVYEIAKNRILAKEAYEPIKDKLKLIDSVGLSIDIIEAYVKSERPDILIIDQLDKIYIDGSYARGDERLKAIYVAAREIAKRYSCVVIGISQASAEGESKAVLTFDMMENSRTGKAAEGDLIIGIGKYNSEGGHDTMHRTLHVCKNKLNGWHGLIHCVIQPPISRYVS